MKTKIIYSILSLVLSTAAFAQDRTTVTAKSYDVSDNLDLKAVASIFGESRDLPDFEQRLNDPSLQISNLDLNGDNEVDYIRVVESTEGNTRLVILQDVLAKDTYQDIATIEVERNGSNVQVQVVGDTYMYGPNYIYEPVYVTRPVFFDVWWGIGYRPYVSSWYWGYYPSYWHVWRPMPIRSYRNHIHVHINNYNTYNYVNVRRNNTAATLYNTRRNDGYARRYPDRSFAQRHENVANQYELDRTRSATRANNAANGTRNNTNGVRNNANNTSPTRNNASGTRDYPTRSNPRVGSNPAVRGNNGATGANANPRTATPRNQAQIRENNAIQGTRNEASPRATAPVRTEASPRQVTPQAQPRQSVPQQVQPRQSAPQMQQQPRQAAPQQMQQPRQSAPQMQQPRQAAPQMQQSAPRAQSPSGGGGATRGGNGGGRR